MTCERATPSSTRSTSLAVASRLRDGMATAPSGEMPDGRSWTKLRLGAGVLVDGDDRGALGEHEDSCRRRSWRLPGLPARRPSCCGASGIVADLAIACSSEAPDLVENLAGRVEDGEAARAALPSRLRWRRRCGCRRATSRRRARAARLPLAGELERAVRRGVDARRGRRCRRRSGVFTVPVLPSMMTISLFSCSVRRSRRPR